MTSISTKDRRYPAFMRLVSLGRAVKGRFMYERDGTKVIEFLSASKVRRNPVASFGKDERKYQRAFQHYGNGVWRMAWWREAIQNAVDAGARRIDLSVERHEGYMLITAVDDGKGMSLEALQTKFLSEGATSKGEHESGGFGVAKELLLMPWMEWYVETNGHWARGFREEPYEYDVLTTPRKGTLLSVKMSDKDGEHTDIEHAIAYIQKCYAPHITFVCNGKKVPADLHLGKDVDKKVFGSDYVKVTYNEKSNIPGVFIRDGSNLFMFSREGLREGSIILTLMGNTKEMLADNRMVFGGYDLPRKLDKFMEKLAIDVSTALKPPPEKIDVSFHAGRGRVISNIESIQADLQMKVARKFQERRFSAADVAELEEAVKKIDHSGESAVVRTTTSPDMVKLIMNLVTSKEAGENVSEAAALHMGHTPDVLMYNECKDELVLPEILLPGPRMSPKAKKLLRIWAEFCRVVLIRLGCSRPFGVGWAIAKAEKYEERKGGFIRAMYGRNMQLSNNETADGDWLLLNPYRRGIVPEGKEKHPFYSIRSDEDLNRLFSLAVHECTHMFTGICHHSERFSSAENDIWTRNIPTSHLIKVIRDAVAKKLPGEVDDGEDVVEKAQSLTDLAESMVATFNKMNTEYVSGQAIEVRRAIEASFDDKMQKATEKWLNRLALAPRFVSWQNHIRQIIKHYAEKHIDVRTIFLKILETVPAEIVKEYMSFHEFALVVAYEAYQVL